MAKKEKQYGNINAMNSIGMTICMLEGVIGSFQSLKHDLENFYIKLEENNLNHISNEDISRHPDLNMFCYTINLCNDMAMSLNENYLVGKYTNAMFLPDEIQDTMKELEKLAKEKNKIFNQTIEHLKELEKTGEITPATATYLKIVNKTAEATKEPATKSRKR